MSDPTPEQQPVEPEPDDGEGEDDGGRRAEPTKPESPPGQEDEPGRRLGREGAPGQNKPDDE